MMPKWMMKMLKMDSLALKSNSIGHQSSLSTASIVRLSADDESNVPIPPETSDQHHQRF